MWLFAVTATTAAREASGRIAMPLAFRFLRDSGGLDRMLPGTWPYERDRSRHCDKHRCAEQSPASLSIVLVDILADRNQPAG